MNLKRRVHCTFVLALLASILYFSTVANAQVHVRGYFRSNGTYVQPHWRSSPDGNPYNNWSFPGNVNPYTGKVAPGDPASYLRHYNRSWTDVAPVQPDSSAIVPATPYGGAELPKSVTGGSGLIQPDNSAMLPVTPHNGNELPKSSATLGSLLSIPAAPESSKRNSYSSTSDALQDLFN
jgi:hypothetical protein